MQRVSLDVMAVVCGNIVMGCSGSDVAARWCSKEWTCYTARSEHSSQACGSVVCKAHDVYAATQVEWCLDKPHIPSIPRAVELMLMLANHSAAASSSASSSPPPPRRVCALTDNGPLRCVTSPQGKQGFAC